jgi:HSP20 family protein
MNTAIANEPGTLTRTETARLISPQVNIFEDKDGYVIEAEMPGVNKDGLGITVEGNELTILGHRAKTEVKAQSLYRESDDADFRRSFELDPAIDARKIEARVDQGLLTLRLPKSEKAKPHKIVVGE